jgi:hypothetical protein
VRLRLLILAAIACFAAFDILKEQPAADGAASAVLGSAMSLSDLVSGTYDRPEESGRKKKKPKVELASKRLPKSKPRQVASKRPKFRDLASGYRTLCVRLCDGYYFPVSAAAAPREFARDEAKCRSGCSSPAMLFVYKNGDGAPETMTSLDGKPYTSLATAFKHRVSYDASCTCTANPWTEAAAERHRLYAAEAAVSEGDLSAEAMRRDLAFAVAETTRKARARSGADLVPTRAAEVIAGGPRQRLETTVSRKAAARVPVVRAKVRNADRQNVRAVRQTAKIARVMRAAAAVRGIARPIRVSEVRLVAR